VIPRDGTLVFSRISQTNVVTGEVEGVTRQRKFGARARHKVREAGAVLERDYGKRIWFLTLTLPGSTVRAIEAYAKYDKEIKNAYLQNFRKLWRRLFPGSPCSLDYLCVSELQKRGAIHLHLAIGWCSDRFAKMVQRCYRGWWHKILLKYSEISAVDLFERDSGGSWKDNPNRLRVECQQVRKRVGSYLAKYLSKSASKLDLAAINSPSRWWNISSSLSKKVLGARVQVSRLYLARDEAWHALEKISHVLRSAGLEPRQMINPFCNQFLGYVFFVDEDKKAWFWEWAQLLLMRGAEEVEASEEDIEFELWVSAAAESDTTAGDVLGAEELQE
jgi:hypothetical protein